MEMGNRKSYHQELIRYRLPKLGGRCLQVGKRNVAFAVLVEQIESLLYVL